MVSPTPGGLASSISGRCLQGDCPKQREGIAEPVTCVTLNRTLCLGLIALVLCSIVRATAAEDLVRGPSYAGMCDASAAAPLGNLGFVVANDEDNHLRVYRRGQGGKAITSFDMTSHLLPDVERPESDIEGCTWLNRRMYWITSHGRNRKAEARESRARLFATRMAKVDGRMTMLADGVPYYDLLDDLLAAPHLQRFELEKAAKRAPKDKDGLNIEGLAATPRGELWIGFRNPIHKGKAIIVPLLNPEEALELTADASLSGQRAKVGFPIELDLHGMGIRSIEYVAYLDEYLILAGPRSGGDVSLYRWSGERHEPPQIVEGINFGSLTPEAFVVYRDGDKTSLQFFSDDGTRKIHGVDCKTLEDPAMRRFRTMVWRGFELPAAD